MATEATALTAVKQEVRLREWSAQIEAQLASGLTVLQWCAENGINDTDSEPHLAGPRTALRRRKTAPVSDP